MSTVWVVQTTSKSIENARRFGDVEVILTDGFTEHESGIDLIYQTILKEFKESDFILMVGNPTFLAAATHAALTVNNGKCRTLVWEKRSMSYHEIKIEL